VRIVEASTVTVMLAEAGAAVSLASGAVKVLACHSFIKKPMEPARVGSVGLTTTGIVSSGGGFVPPPLLSCPPLFYKKKKTHIQQALIR
jgi:hypothetical protein